MAWRLESISDRNQWNVWEAWGVVESFCPPGSRSGPSSSYRLTMLKPAPLARGQVAGMVNAFDHPSHSSTGEVRMESPGEDFRCLLTGGPEKRFCPGSTDFLCFAWQSHFAVLALMTLEGTVSRHQRSHRLRKRLPEPPARQDDPLTPAGTPDNWPRSALRHCVDYGFYKSGLEVTSLHTPHFPSRCLFLKQGEYQMHRKQRDCSAWTPCRLRHSGQLSALGQSRLHLRPHPSLACGLV